MITTSQTFYSNTHALKASLYLPDDYRPGEKLPCIIANSGYIGLNVIYPALFARALTAKGFAVFGFDYRGFVESGGPAGVCKLEEQVEDIRNAITFVGTLDEVDGGRVGLIGWAMAAATIAKVAAVDNRVRALAGLNGFYNGARWLASVYSYYDFVKMQKEIEELDRKMVLTGERTFDNPFHFYPLDPDTDGVVKSSLYTVKNYGQDISLEIGKSIMEFDAEKYASYIKVPMFVGHGRYNLLHPVSESQLFFDKLSCEKQLYLIDGKHNDFMFDDHPVFAELIERLTAFFAVL